MDKCLDINTIDTYIFFIEKGILKLLKLESSLSEMRTKLLSQGHIKNPETFVSGNYCPAFEVLVVFFFNAIALLNSLLSP